MLACCRAQEAGRASYRIESPQFSNQEKGVLAKGVSVESSVTANKTNSTQGIGPSSTFGTQSVAAKRGVHFAETPF